MNQDHEIDRRHFLRDLVHLPEWTFDRKYLNVFPLTLTSTLTLILTLKHKNLFGKKK